MAGEQEKMSAVECTDSCNKIGGIMGFLIKIFLIAGILFTIATFLRFFFPLNDDALLLKMNSPIMAIVFFIASATIKYINEDKK